MENDVLDALEDLCYKGTILEEGALVKAVEGDGLSVDFMSLAVWIVKELKKVCSLGENLTETEDQETFKLEVSGLLNELGNPHPTLSGVNGLDSVPNRLLLLDYLTSELQACRMLGGVSEEKMEIDHQTTCPTLQQVQSILSVLDLPLPGKDATVFTLFSQIENKVRQMLSTLPKQHLGEPLLKKRLSENQWSKVEEINTQLNNEYSLRRQMLLKRLDVTVQSFGWSDKAKTKKDEMIATFQPLRKSMNSLSTVNVADVVASRTDLLQQPRTSAGDIREKTKCPINRVLMGKVPDRGGRPSTMNPPPPEMPFFRKRQDAPKNQRPQSGRGGGGGRGGRGRGQKVPGNWYGGHGGGVRGGGHSWGGGGGRGDRSKDFWGGDNQGYSRKEYYS